jgi:hypothetical protein
MWTALSGVIPRVNAGSVHVKTESPFRARAAAIAVRSSVMWTALMTVVCATRVLSVKLLVVKVP